jgi:hypothetical protein
MALPAFVPRRASGSRGAADNAVIREIGLQKLLSTPVCELGLEVEGALAECIEQVDGELRAKGISFLPSWYLGDDDFWTADRAVSVNVPWYLANPVLWQLVNDHLFEYTRAEVLMYLRHEAGHALNYAFELWKRKDWSQMFGDFRRPYRDVYTANPWSRDFVRYLHKTGMYHYAQKHPDEDWSETFAAWLDPSTRWRYRYRNWQVALAKLEYVDRIIDVEGVCSGTPSNQRPGQRIPYTSIKETVAQYLNLGSVVDPHIAQYRRELLKIFPKRGARGTSNAQSAARFIKQNQKVLEEHLATWIRKSNRRAIHRFLRQLEALCTYEHLVVPESRREEKLVDLTIVATWHVVDDVHRLSG